jgi:hypothetical protein
VLRARGTAGAVSGGQAYDLAVSSPATPLADTLAQLRQHYGPAPADAAEGPFVWLDVFALPVTAEGPLPLAAPALREVRPGGEAGPQQGPGPGRGCCPACGRARCCRPAVGSRALTSGPTAVPRLAPRPPPRPPLQAVVGCGAALVVLDAQGEALRRQRCLYALSLAATLGGAAGDGGARPLKVRGEAWSGAGCGGGQSLECALTAAAHCVAPHGFLLPVRLRPNQHHLPVLPSRPARCAARARSC